MKVMRQIAGQIETMDIDPKNLKTFRRYGWVESPDNFKHEAHKPETTKAEEVKTPEKKDYSNMNRAELIEEAVLKNMKRGVASQSKKDDLINFLTK